MSRKNKYSDFLENGLKDEYKKKAFEHYKKTKRFGLDIVKDYSKDNRDRVIRLFIIREAHLKYIYLKLDIQDKEWFKNDVIDKLTKLKDEQSKINYKSLVEKILNQVRGYGTEIISDKATNELSLSQIALIYVYNKKSITPQNCDDVAKEYGWKSGRKLYQKFNKYSSYTDRKAKPDPFSSRKVLNKINLLESVINYVEVPNKQRVLDELSILKSYII